MDIFPNIILGTMIVLDEPEPIKRKPKRRISNSDLKALSTNHKPPQNWYDNDADDVSRF